MNSDPEIEAAFRKNRHILIRDGATEEQIQRFEQRFREVLEPLAPQERAQALRQQMHSFLASGLSIAEWNTQTVAVANLSKEEIATGRTLREEFLAGVPEARRMAVREILDQSVADYDAVHDDVRTRLSQVVGVKGSIVTRFWEVVFPAFAAVWVELVERSKRITLPPTLNTPNNLEAFWMAFGYTFEPLHPLIDAFAAHLPAGTDQTVASESVMLVVRHYIGTRQPPAVHRLYHKLGQVNCSNRDGGTLAEALAFSTFWLKSGFAKLEVSQKLAASFALTDIPDDIEVRAPWHAWSLIVPPDLIEGVSRLWCIGDEARFIVTTQGELIGPVTTESMRQASGSSSGSVVRVIESLVRSCCVALSNPDEHRRNSSREGRGGRSHREGPPDFSATRFLLSTPVSIDMRPHLKAYLADERPGGAPTAQFLVRGHWRNQAHGARRTLRKQIWIQPFWKGPEETRVLLRRYQVKDDPK